MVNASEFLGTLLNDLCKGSLVGGMYFINGNKIDDKPTLLSDKVIAYFMDRDYRTTGNTAAAMMNS